MRVLWALLTCVAILGGLGLFLNVQTPAPRPLSEKPPVSAPGDFSVELTATYTSAAGEADPFALDSAPREAALTVRVAGQPAVNIERCEAGLPIRVPRLAGLVEGANELIVAGQPPSAEATRWQAIRVRVLRDGEPIADQTVWSAPGAPFQDRILVQLPAVAPEPHP